jgi:glucokinase
MMSNAQVQQMQCVDDEPCVLADIGGTHIRLGITDSHVGDIQRTEKYPVADFTTLEDALDFYVSKQDIPTQNIRIATAAWPHEDGVWRFAHKDRWDISIKSLEREGWVVKSIENDFMASAKGSYFIEGNQMVSLRGKIAAHPDCGRFLVLGPGTGLGMAVIDYGDKDNINIPDVRTTYGGHMIAPARTEEHREILSVMQAELFADKPLLAEYTVSGPGLDFLYKAVSFLDGDVVTNAFDMDYILQTKETARTKTVLRLFHEFLGLTLHQAILFNHSFDGIYLDGGVTQRLIEHDLFMIDAVVENLGAGHVPVVQSSIDAVPIAAINDPFIALRGLKMRKPAAS